MTPARAQGRWLVVAGLRRWAEGSATDEAAVELLVGLGARFTHQNCPWVRPCRRSGWFWVDADHLRHVPGRRLTNRDQQVLALVVALLTGQPVDVTARSELGRAA